jgi:hypothetical protein
MVPFTEFLDTPRIALLPNVPSCRVQGLHLSLYTADERTCEVGATLEAHNLGSLHKT